MKWFGVRDEQLFAFNMIARSIGFGSGQNGWRGSKDTNFHLENKYVMGIYIYIYQRHNTVIQAVEWIMPHTQSMHTHIQTSRNATTESLCAKQMSWLVMVTEEDRWSINEIRGHHPPPHRTGRLPRTLTTSGVLLSSCPVMLRTWDGMVKILTGLLPWILGESYTSFLTHDPFSFFSDYDLWHSPTPLWGW